MNLTTPYQDSILAILKSGGKIIMEFRDGSLIRHSMINGNVKQTVRGDTVLKLEKMKFISSKIEGTNIITYRITKLGADWVELISHITKKRRKK